MIPSGWPSTSSRRSVDSGANATLQRALATTQPELIGLIVGSYGSPLSGSNAPLGSAGS